MTDLVVVQRVRREIKQQLDLRDSKLAELNKTTADIKSDEYLIQKKEIESAYLVALKILLKKLEPVLLEDLQLEILRDEAEKRNSIWNRLKNLFKSDLKDGLTIGELSSRYRFRGLNECIAETIIRNHKLRLQTVHQLEIKQKVIRFLNAYIATIDLKVEHKFNTDCQHCLSIFKEKYSSEGSKFYKPPDLGFDMKPSYGAINS